MTVQHQQSPPAPLMTYLVAGREYAQRTVRECHVCMSPYRLDIELGLVRGMSARVILEGLPDDARISTTSVLNHSRRKHMPDQQWVLNQIVMRRAEGLGKDIVEHNLSLVDGVALAEGIIQRAWERLASGDAEPTMKDALEAAKFLDGLGAAGTGVDQQAILQAFILIQEEAQRHMGDSTYAQFANSLNHNPILHALATRWANQHGLEPPQSAPGQPVVVTTVQEQEKPARRRMPSQVARSKRKSPKAKAQAAKVSKPRRPKGML